MGITIDTPIQGAPWSDDNTGLKNAYFDSTDNWTQLAASGTWAFTHSSDISIPLGDTSPYYGTGFGKLGLYGPAAQSGNSRAHIYQAITFSSDEVGKTAYFSFLGYTSKSDNSVSIQVTVSTHQGASDVYSGNVYTGITLALDNMPFEVTATTLYVNVLCTTDDGNSSDWIAVDRFQVFKPNQNSYENDGSKPTWITPMSPAASWSSDSPPTTTWT